MKLILLGTAGFIPTDQAQTACLMLPEVGILLDAGTGMYRMNKYLQTDKIDIYLSHAHGDHTRGLVFLFASFFVHQIHQMQAVVDETNIADIGMKANHRLHTTRIHASQPALDFLSKEYEPYQMDWHLMNDQEPLPNGGTITAFNVGNNDEIGFRLDWPGHSMAYVTDTVARPDAPYMDCICGVDLLVHECNGPERLAKLMAQVHHSSTLAVARVASVAQAGRLVLVHKNPIPEWSIDEDLHAARAIFPATDIGMDGMELEF